MRRLAEILNRPVLAIVAVAAIAGGLRFYHLSNPPERVFDEVYYSKDGCIYAGYANKVCGITSDDEKYWVHTYGETSWVHPPLGRWAIAAGEKLFGPHPFGWRASAAVAGTASCVIVALIAQLLWGSALWTFIAGLLLATESLNLVQSRTSMLDIFVTFWVVLGFLFLLMDRRWIDRRTTFGKEGVDEHGDPTVTPSLVPSPLWRPWRMACGFALGAAVSTKWSGASAIIAAGLLSLFWERTRRARGNLTEHAFWRAVQQELAGLIIAFAFVPIAVYLLSYARFWVDNGIDISTFVKQQGAMLSYHWHLKATATNTKTGKTTPIHPYLSRAWTWIVVGRPVAYFFKAPGTEILGMGNPVIFWSSLLAIPYTVLAWRRRRDFRAGFLALAVLGQYLPWFGATRPLFFFYMAPITPFLVLTDVYAAKALSEFRFEGASSRAFVPVSVGFVVLSVAAFAFFWPVLTAHPLSHAAWQLRMWFPSWI